MISDHGEVMSTIQTKISNLNQALNDKNYAHARFISNEIIDGMEAIWQWSIKKEQGN